MLATIEDFPAETLSSIVDALLVDLEPDEHRQTLYSLCLVSEPFRNVAQPKLHRRIEIKRANQVASIVAGGKDQRRGQATRELYVKPEVGEPLFSLLPVFRALRYLDTVTIVDFPAGLRLEEWEALSRRRRDKEGERKPKNLRHLFLSGTPFPFRFLRPNQSPGLVFPSLTHLAIKHARCSKIFVEHLLTPAILPRLAVLDISALTSHLTAIPFLSDLSTSFIAQLDLIVYRVADLPFRHFRLETPTRTRPLAAYDGTCAVASLNSLSCDEYQQLCRLMPARLAILNLLPAEPSCWSTCNVLQAHELLENLKQLVIWDDSPLRIVWLPAFLQPHVLLPDFLVSLRQDFFLDCRTRGVDVLWFDEKAGVEQFVPYAQALKSRAE
ncbi:hypothetical protein JCM8547_007018 [Rhodosporidiobolus lusitaniae]